MRVNWSAVSVMPCWNSKNAFKERSVLLLWGLMRRMDKQFAWIYVRFLRWCVYQKKAIKHNGDENEANVPDHIHKNIGKVNTSHVSQTYPNFKWTQTTQMLKICSTLVWVLIVWSYFLYILASESVYRDFSVYPTLVYREIWVYTQKSRYTTKCCKYRYKTR